MDHGFLNTPLKSRGDIDKQIDAYKADQAAEKRRSGKLESAQLADRRAVAKSLLAGVSKDRISALAGRIGQPVATLSKHLKSESHWNPDMIIKLFS